jgi:short subunit dehydrogenase-like uncharacterized protein
MSNRRWMIYGVNGYTGKLLVARARAAGLSPILAGRSGHAVRALGREHGCETRVFALDDPQLVEAQLHDIDAVLHCAGPFSATAEPMVSACLTTATHYLDITGEVDVLEAVAARRIEARRAGVVLLPGIGYAASDCLAAAVARRLPSATSLDIAFTGLQSSSPGTTRTTLEGLMAAKGYVRRDGRLLAAGEAHYCRTVPFPSATRHTTSISWGDVALAPRSTGIDNVTVFVAMPRVAAWSLTLLMPVLVRLLRFSPLRRWLDRGVERLVHGPSESQRAREQVELYAEARSADGLRVSGTMVTGNIYDVTVSAALEAIRRVLNGEVPAGLHTPSSAFGVMFASTLPGVEMRLG